MMNCMNYERDELAAILEYSRQWKVPNDPKSNLQA